MNENYKYVTQNIGLRIRNKRRMLKLTQGQVAENAGMLRTSLTNIEAGRAGFTIENLYRLSDAMGIAAIDLMPRNEDVHFDVEANAEDALIKLAACIVSGSPASMAEAELRAKRVMGWASEPTDGHEDAKGRSDES